MADRGLFARQHALLDKTKVATGMLRRVGHQHQLCQISIACQRQVAKIDVAPDVTVHHKERRAIRREQVRPQRARAVDRAVTQRRTDAASSLPGAGRLGGIADRRTPARPVAQRRDDLFAKVRVVDDDVAQAGRHQAFDVPDDERFATDRQEGFGRAVGQRPHTFAAAGGKNHGAARSQIGSGTGISHTRSSG